MFTFYPNCTIPLKSPAFVTGPDTRSTFEIVWSCLSVLLLCVWSTLPLNVPPQVDPKTSLEKFRRRLYLFLRKVKWMAITLLAPEFIMGKAFSDAWSAWRYGGPLKQMAQNDRVPWTTAHTFFADMGGFTLIFEDHNTNVDPGPQDLDWRPKSQGVAPNNVRAQSSFKSWSLSSPVHPGVPDSLHIRSDQYIKSDGIEAQLDTIRPGAPPEQMSITNHSHQIAHHVSDVGSDIGGPNDFGNREIIIQRSGVEEIFRGFPGRNMEKLKGHGNIHWTRDAQYSMLAENLLSEASSKADEVGVWGMQDVASSVQGLKHIASDVNLDSGFYEINLTALQGKIWVLCARQIIKARELGVINRLPELRVAELDDKDKADIFVRGLFFTQIIWLIIQLSSRWKDGKPCAQLEIMTFAFAVSSLIIQFLHRSRPQDVTVPFIVHANRVTERQMKEIAMQGPGYTWYDRGLYTLPNNSVFNAQFAVGALFGAFLFGAFHLIAWHFVFPTETEENLWKASSFVITFAPFGILVFTAVTMRLLGCELPVLRDYLWYKAFVRLIVLSFVLARLFLIVESFRSLYFLPPDAFTATWVVDFPHIF
ncbi:hypothetical protein BCR34DRAFT_316767 [Clohesyomyces aquaticus]|uniref:Uncharacterized protein n=1 Tax=Clohesyomyces aquaticus TaxID=1231657 RepID=A0A1Y1ZN92_9PLEO|nr:hypothetical protein BCR34DRAFT_316767 [Clohesyomyces aquaticus]